MIDPRPLSKLLAAIAAVTFAAPVLAGDTCELADGDPGTEDNGGASANGLLTFACGFRSRADADGTAVGEFADASGRNSTAIGSIARTAGDNGTAVGNLAAARDIGAVSVGAFSDAGNAFSTALGTSSRVRGDGGTATGARAESRGLSSTANGFGTMAVGDNSTAVGGLLDRDGNNDITLDIDSDGDGEPDASSEVTRASGSWSSAFGSGAQATAVHTTAVGAAAQAAADNSVALGQGSVADRANTVSVGSAGGERQVTNVADGTGDTDAVNVRQLRASIATLNLELGSGFDALRDEFNDRFRFQDARISKIGAMSAAMSQMTSSAAGIRADNRLATGVGFQGGEAAFALGYQRAIGSRAAFTIGAAFSGSDEDSVGVGYGIGW